MQNDIPSGKEVTQALNDLGGMSLSRLASITGASLTTLHRISKSDECNPGVDTVRKFWPTVQMIRLGKDESAKPARMSAKP